MWEVVMIDDEIEIRYCKMLEEREVLALGGQVIDQGLEGSAIGSTDLSGQQFTGQLE